MPDAKPQPLDPNYPEYCSEGHVYQAPKEVADAWAARRAGRRIVEIGVDEEGCSILAYDPPLDRAGDGQAA